MSRVRTLLLMALLLAGTIVLAPGGLRPVRAAGAAGDPMLMAAGDVADCNQPYDEATAALVNKAPGATVVVNGHVHLYERFPHQSSAGNLDPNGMREFIVGTGGGPPDRFDPAHIDPHSESRHDNVFGVLELSLHAAAYDWAFEATDGSILDSGSDTCSPASGGSNQTTNTTAAPVPTTTSPPGSRSMPPSPASDECSPPTASCTPFERQPGWRAR